jgi:two-component system nitrate/nitrite response regulator NarL
MLRFGNPQNKVSPMSIKVLLADDSEIVRRAIRQLLAAQTEIEIVGESSDFVQTIQMTKDLEPRVVILDLHMPDENQIEPQDVRSQLNQGVKVLAVSLSNDEDAQELAKNLGAAVLLDKMDLAHTLIPTIMQLSCKSRAAA